MYKSILHFIENGLVEIEKMMGDILAGKKDADDLTALVNKVTSTLAVSLIADLYEKADNDIRESSVRKKYWNAEHRNKKKTIVDVMGKVEFCRTGYCAKDQLIKVKSFFLKNKRIFQKTHELKKA
jgi:hypothetical protein